MKNSLNLKQFSKTAKRFGGPVMRHFYFVFIMLLVSGVGVSVYYVANTFNMNTEDYRLEKELEFADDVRLRRDDNVVDKVLQLQTAKSGPIQPDYVPSRDNPFKE